ncbi:hypothetical protein GCM10023192_79890 [Amycolatopsis samaneae]
MNRSGTGAGMRTRRDRGMPRLGPPARIEAVSVVRPGPGDQLTLVTAAAVLAAAGLGLGRLGLRAPGDLPRLS